MKHCITYIDYKRNTQIQPDTLHIFHETDTLKIMFYRRKKLQSSVATYFQSILKINPWYSSFVTVSSPEKLQQIVREQRIWHFTNSEQAKLNYFPSNFSNFFRSLLNFPPAFSNPIDKISFNDTLSANQFVLKFLWIKKCIIKNYVYLKVCSRQNKPPRVMKQMIITLVQIVSLNKHGVPKSTYSYIPLCALVDAFVALHFRLLVSPSVYFYDRCNMSFSS